MKILWSALFHRATIIMKLHAHEKYVQSNCNKKIYHPEACTKISFVKMYAWTQQCGIKLCIGCKVCFTTDEAFCNWHCLQVKCSETTTQLGSRGQQSSPCTCNGVAPPGESWWAIITICISSITWKRDLIHKTGSTQCTALSLRTEPQPRLTQDRKFHEVLTRGFWDIQADIQICNTSQPCRTWSISNSN